MRVEGRNNREIAEQLDVKIETLYEWFSDEKIKAEIDRLGAEIDSVFAQRMAELALVGISELTAAAAMPMTEQALTPHQKLEFLREALDRTPATAKVGAEGGGGPSVNNFILPPGMTTEQLVQRGRQLLGKAGALDHPVVGSSAKDIQQ